MLLNYGKRSKGETRIEDKGGGMKGYETERKTNPRVELKVLNWLLDSYVRGGGGRKLRSRECKKGVEQRLVLPGCYPVRWYGGKRELKE